MGRRSDERAKLVYDVIDQSNGFYSCAIEHGYRSRVNACFRIGGQTGDEALEKSFVEEAKKRNIIGIKGHRLVGGIRVSMFNAFPVEDAITISQFMTDFMKIHSK